MGPGTPAPETVALFSCVIALALALAFFRADDAFFLTWLYWDLVMLNGAAAPAEPTGDLDEKTAEALHALLREMHRERQLSSVIATHNLHLAASCDRVFRLEGGRLILA